MITAKPLRTRDLGHPSESETPTNLEPRLNLSRTSARPQLNLTRSEKKIKVERKPLYIGGKIQSLLITVVEQGYGMTCSEITNVMTAFCKKMNCHPIPDFDSVSANLKKLTDKEKIVRVKIPNRPFLYYRSLK